MGYRFEIFKGSDGQFYWRFRAPNGEKMAGSEGYTAKASAVSAVNSIRQHAAGAEVVDLT